MPFIGNQPALSYTSFAKQDFTTSVTTSYTLDNPVTNANELALFINFVRQEPTTAYSASGTSLTLTSATSATDDMYCVFLGKAVQTVNPPNGSVGTAQLIDGAVTSAKLASGAVANTPAFLAYLGSNQNPSDVTTTDVTINTEVFDVGSCFNTSTYTFTPNVAGKYLLFAAIRVGSDTSRPAFIEMQARIRKNDGNCANQLLSSYSVSNLDGFNIPITTIVEANGSSDAFKIDTYLDVDAGTITITAGQHQTYFGGYKIIE
jgi:hypothetical protein